MIILVFWPDILGKSFLIKHAAVDLIENNKLIIFILPTKALLEEYLIDLKSILNEKGVKDINVSKSVSQVDKESKIYWCLHKKDITHFYMKSLMIIWMLTFIY